MAQMGKRDFGTSKSLCSVYSSCEKHVAIFFLYSVSFFKYIVALWGTYIQQWTAKG